MINKRISCKSMTAIVLVFIWMFCQIVVSSTVKAENWKSELPRIIKISTPEELISVAEMLSTDEVSDHMVIILENDINLTGYNFKGIPTFKGTFKGQNYTINGIDMTHSGSVYGFFRYVQQGGLIIGLNIEGSWSLAGSRTIIGGIAGDNSGKIVDCSVNGNIEGKEIVGGIVGINRTTGSIINSSFDGLIDAESFAGGIAGQNFGRIIQATNYGEVNISESTPIVKLDELDVKDLESSAEKVYSLTDMGGIAGYNRGQIVSSVNQGAIGYPHVGYNVGGIVGRQDGYINGCMNYALIQGRKDVGGIIGQMEPYRQLYYDESFVNQLRTELDTLESLLNNVYDQVDDSNQATTNSFSGINEAIDRVSSDMENLSTATTNYVDESTEQVNHMSERMQEVTDDMNGVIEDFRLSNVALKEALEDMKLGMDELSEASGEMSEAFEDLEKAMDALDDATNQMDEGLEQMKSGFSKLKEAMTNNDDLEAAIADIKNGMDKFNSGITSATLAMEQIAQLMADLSGGSVTDIDKRLEEISTNLANARESMSESTKDMENALDHLQKEFEKDSVLIESAMVYMDQAMLSFQSGMGHFNSAIGYMTLSIMDMNEMSQALELGTNHFSNSTEHLTVVSTHMNNAIEKIQAIVKRESESEAFTLPVLQEQIEKESDQFYTSVDTLNNQLKAFNAVTSNSATLLTEDMRLVNQQVFVVLNLLIDAYEKATGDETPLTADISGDGFDQIETEDDSLDEIKVGWVEHCYNYGDIQGDVNVGGVVGTMAIDYEYDPEGELTKEKTKGVNYQYQTKAVLLSSQNEGNIIGKKDYIGGIVGKMELGYLGDATNNSLVKSTNGNYVGGIAGGSYATITECHSVSKLSGNDYIGGICGVGTSISDCRSMIEVIGGKEYIGSIAGDVENAYDELHVESDSMNITNNEYVTSEYGGIDGIGYIGRAEEVSYSHMVHESNIPTAFTNLGITFIYEDGRRVEVPFQYGDYLDEAMIPELVVKDGEYAYWPIDVDEALYFSQEIHIAYKYLSKTLAFKENNEQIIMIEGSFTPGSKLIGEKLSSIDYKDNIPSNYKAKSVWQIGLEGNVEVNGKVKYRIKAPEEQQLTVLVENNGEWSKPDLIRDGSYLVWDSYESHEEVRVMLVSTKEQILWRYIGFGVAVLSIGILLMKVIKKRRG